MKVGFDGVLLGAWADTIDCRRILDVGSGCGLISLMIAQRTASVANVEIHSVEVDEAAHLESIENVAGSPWHHRIRCHRRSIQDFAGMAFSNPRSETSQYDLIVCNPPFFDAGSEKSDDTGPRAIARHAIRLTANELIQIASGLLAPSGRLSVIVPIGLRPDWTEHAFLRGLNCRRCTTVKPNPSTDAKRVLLEFQFDECETIENVVAIESDRRHVYSDEFIALTRDFYLKM